MSASTEAAVLAAMGAAGRLGEYERLQARVAELTAELDALQVPDVDYRDDAYAAYVLERHDALRARRIARNAARRMFNHYAGQLARMTGAGA